MEVFSDRLFLAAVFISITAVLSGQTILNGSFELNNQPCGINLTNSAFNQSIQGVIAFGEQEETDLLSSSCGYGEAADGSAYLGLYSLNGADAISLKLSAPLDTGKTYILRYADKNGLGFSPNAGKVQIGLSDVPDDFDLFLFQGPGASAGWTSRTIVFKPAKPYQYITVTVTSTAEAWVFVDHFEFICPEIDLGNDTSLCVVENVLLEIRDTFDQIYWNDGSTEKSLWVNEPGLYWVVGISGGCEVRDSVVIGEIEQQCNCRVFIPNVFSPNFDGINDLFFPASPCELYDYELLIFDRWGQHVFHTDSLQAGWDGTVKEKAAEQGVYTYRLLYRFSYSKHPEVEVGTLLLIR